MIIKKVVFPGEGEGHQKVLFEKVVDDITINYGTVVLEEGTRFPEEGMTKHTEHEYSYITEGMIEMIDDNGNSIGILQAGDIINIDPQEDHAGFIKERCKIVYVLIGKVEPS